MDVIIKIRGTIIAGSEKPDIVDVTTDGKYITRNGKQYISYRESQITGLEGVTTIVKVEDENCVTLMRTGKTNSRLIIQKGQRQLCHYGTQFGDMMVGISGCHIKSNLTDNGGDIKFNYTLDINSNEISFNEVFISVKEANQSNVKFS